MKKLDYLIVSLCVIVDVILLLLPGCRFDIYAFSIWLAAIGMFVVSMHSIERKKERQRLESADEIDSENSL